MEVRNTFNGLDLIDRVPDELWMEVRDIVQETRSKTIPKKCKNAKWLSEEALQIAVKRTETKNKGEKERYKHLNAEFQRIARRDKKAFLSDQGKEIEEDNRMGKTRDLFKKIRDINNYIKYKRSGASQVMLVIKNPPANEGDIMSHGFNPCAGKIWQPTTVFLPGESHG